MVSTRRTSLRLQEKVASAPSSPASDTPTPTRARKAAASSSGSSTGSATKKSPRTGSATKAKTPPKRGGSKRAAATAAAATTAPETASDSSNTTADAPSASEPSTAATDVAKELFHERESASEQNSAESVSEQDGSVDNDDTQSELKSGESTEDDDAVEPVMVPVTEAAAPVAAVPVVAEPAAPTEVAVEAEKKDEEKQEVEEEEVMLLMDDDDDDDADDDDEEEEAADAAAEDDDDDDEDISAYVQMATSGINLSTTAPSIPVASIAKPMRAALVPDTLDSGASQHAQYFAFQGRACGATLLPAKRAEEERATLAKQAHVTATASRQRAEHANKKSAGRKWFDMASEELTPEVRRDFALLRMRNYLDPKKFYKTSDHHKALPKHFQLGVVIEGAHEFKSARLTKKQRHQTFTDEIMADAGIQTYTKRVFGQIQAARSGQGKKKRAKTSSRY